MAKNYLFQLKLKKIILLGFMALAIFSGVLFVQHARAEVKGEGLTISPPISEYSIKPGESSVQTIRLTNPTGKLVEVYPKAMNFKAKGEGGEPAFFDSSDETTKFSLGSWVSFTQPKIVLTPEQIVEFKYTVTVPADAEPGGHYGVIFFASEPPKTDDGSSKVALSSMVGSLVLVKVPGQVVEKSVLEEFSSSRKIYLNGDVNLATRISNIGNVHVKPKGTVKIKGLFGDKKEIDFNDQGGNVLPDSIRKFETKWSPQAFSFGPYHADLALVYGESEKSLVGSATFWIIPLWIIVPVLLVATCIIVWLVLRLRKRKMLRSVIPKKNEADGDPKNQNSDGGSNIILR